MALIPIVGPSRSTERRGAESTITNFNLNLLQLVIAHIPSVRKQRMPCIVHSKMAWKPKMGENHIILFLYYIKITFILLAPTGL